MKRTLTQTCSRTLHRRGAALVVAMMALLIASIIGGVIVKTVLAEQRLVLREQDRQQAEWLAESGLQRAIARLEKDAGYSGERWTIPASELGGRHNAVVQITVEKVATSPDRRRIIVVADFPTVDPQRCRSRRDITIPAKPAG